jgi:hypothetical protein
MSAATLMPSIETPTKTTTTSSDPIAAHESDGLLMTYVPFVRVIDNVCDAAMCAALVARIEALGPSFAPITTSRGFVERPDIRNNDRVIFDDVDLAADLFARLAPHLPMQRFGDGPEERRGREGIDPCWRAVALNERFRGYRYRPGQRFAPHYDGAFSRSDVERSAITVLFYLNDVTSGGETKILDWGVTVAPKRGSVLVFDHHVLHEGAALVAGEKYVLRTDVMFRAADPAPARPGP